MLKSQKSKDESGAKKIQKNMLFKIRTMYFLPIEIIKDEVPGDTKEMLKNDKKNIFGCCVFYKNKPCHAEDISFLKP